MTSILNTRFAFRRLSNAARGLTYARRLSTMHDNDPDILEAEKKRNLSNLQHKTSTPHKHAPGWNEILASESEADVKADRAEPASTSQLQEQTIEYVTSRYTPDDRKGPTTAQYTRDEVDGPLGHALGHEDGQELYQTVVKKVKKKTTVVEEDSARGYT